LQIAEEPRNFAIGCFYPNYPSIIEEDKEKQENQDCQTLEL
jgi:hypothetical protein